jgi:transposase InsO family protein
MIYEFMDNHKNQFSIVKMSQVLGVSRSGYYRWRGRGPSDRTLKNKRLNDRIKEIWKDSYKTYGSPRIHEQLKKEGETASRPRVARLMKKMGIQSQLRATWTTTTDSNHHLPVAGNLLDRDFSADHMDPFWVGDITYLPSRNGWL